MTEQLSHGKGKDRTLYAKFGLTFIDDAVSVDRRTVAKMTSSTKATSSVTVRSALFFTTSPLSTF